MCDTHGMHVTVVDGLPRCVLCGKQIFPKAKTRVRDIPREMINRHRARRAWWNQPVFDGGLFRY